MKTVVLLFTLLMCCACQRENEIVTKESDGTISASSIFNLTSTWRTEEGEAIQLHELKGKVLVVVMIYTSCKVACPQLVADMKKIEQQIPEEHKAEVQYVLVSIDPEADTPEKLKTFAVQNNMDGKEWTFLQGDESSVREFANVLAVKYKEIAPMDFSHSNIISVFDRNGELVCQQEGLSANNETTVQSIIETAASQ
jgi:protein SCO1